jgi:hypothetical protein
MKNTFIKLLIAVSLLVGVADKSKAASATLLVTTNYITNMLSLSNSYLVNNMNIGAAGTGIATIKFYDNNLVTNGITALAYTNVTYITTNITNFITNSGGFVQSNIYTGLYTSSNLVAAGSLELPVIAAYTVIGGQSPLNIPVSLQFNRGIVLTNTYTNSVYINIDYRTMK